MGRDILIFNWMDIKNPKAGGQEKYCLEIGKRLARDGFTVTWITSKFKGGSQTDTYDGINVIRVGNIFSVYVISFLKYLKYIKADFVFISINAIPFLAPFHRSRRIIMLYHRIDYKIMKAKIGFLGVVSLLLQEHVNPMIYGRDLVITDSESSREDFMSIGYRNIDVVKLGVDLHEVTESLKENLIISPGPVKPWKHHDWAIEAFSGVENSWKLVIFGSFESEGYRKHLQELATNLGVFERVNFLGRISDDEVKRIYQKSKICLLATEKEGWGLVAMEAQSFGCPVVAFDVAGIRDSVVDRKTGILVRFGDIAAMKYALKRVTSDENLLRELSSAAVVRSREYDWELCYDDFRNEMQKLGISFCTFPANSNGQTMGKR